MYKLITLKIVTNQSFIQKLLYHMSKKTPATIKQSQIYFAEDQQNDKKPTLEYQEDPYSDRGQAIELAKKALNRKDPRFIQKDTTLKPRVIIKANAIYQHALHRAFDNTKTGEQMIYQTWPLQYDKNINYSSGTQNSSDNQVEFVYPSCDDIIDIISTQKQEGVIYFFIKINSPKDKSFNIFIKRIKGGGHDIPIPQLVDKKDMYHLYKINITSQIKVFTINLQFQGRIKTSKQYSFSVERIQYDVGLSYDFVTNKELSMSVFEGLIAAASFNSIQQINFFQKSLYTFQEKLDRLLNEQIRFDDSFDSFVRNQKNVKFFLLLFQAILKFPTDQKSKIQLYQNTVIQKIANHFIKIMLNYEMKMEEENLITLGKAQSLIQIFFQISSIEQISQNNFNFLFCIDETKLKEKLLQYTDFLIKQKLFLPVQKYLFVLTQNKHGYLCGMKGLGSFIDIISDSSNTFDETYVDLVITFISYYMKCSQLGQVQLISAVIRAFSNKKFSFEGFDEQDRFSYLKPKHEKPNQIKQIQQQIAYKITIPAKNYKLFEEIFKLMREANKYQYIKQIFSNKNLLKTVQNFSNVMISQIPLSETVQKLQNSIKIIIDFSLNGESKRINQISKLFTKLIGCHSKSIDPKRKLIVIHKEIFNIVIKNGKYMDTVKSMCCSLAEQMTKFLFGDKTEMIDASYDPNSFSDSNTQQVYQNMFLKKVFQSDFFKGNASYFEGCTKEYANWHNQFRHKPFINSFLVQNVTRIICEKNSTQNRSKGHSLQVLKKMIENGRCSRQQKQNLKTIVEIDEFDLDQKTFLQVIVEKRNRLVILRKIRQDGSLQQKNLLQKIVQQFYNKVLNDLVPFKIIKQISLASQYDKNLIKKIFDTYDDIIPLINQKGQQCSQCLQKLSKLRALIESLDKQYTLTDKEKILTYLLTNQTSLQNNKIIFRRQILAQTQKIDQLLLKFYNFQSFFRGETAVNITFSQALLKCEYLTKRIIQKRDTVIQQYQANKLTFQSISFFQRQFQREKQLKQLFMINLTGAEENMSNSNIVKQLLKMFSWLQKIPRIHKAIQGLLYYLKIDETKKYDCIKETLLSFSNYLSQIVSKSPTTNISKLYKEFQSANEAVSRLKLEKNESMNLDSQKSLVVLEILTQMSLNWQQKLFSILKIKPELQQMKQRCSEDEQNYLVHYQDLEQTDALISYAQNVFLKQVKNIKSLIQETHKFFSANNKLKHACLVFQKSKKLIREYQNVRKGDKKIADQIALILQKCKVQLMFDANSNLGIFLTKQESLQKNIMKEGKTQVKVKKSVVNEQQIQKYNNEAVFYLGQSNYTKISTEQQTKIQNYKSFIQLLKMISKIKQIWVKLKEWGFIIFNKDFQQGSSNFRSMENIQIEIIDKNFNKLVEYVDLKSELCEEWIKNIKFMHQSSPKATLLQGQALKDFYEVLTNKQPIKIVNFLNICEPSIIKRFVQENKQKYVRDQTAVLNLISRFFDFMNKQQKIQTHQFKDQGQCYIKTAIFNEKNKDFISGIVELDINRIKSLDITKILICTNDTTTIDIKSFIETALRDNKNQYIIIRPEKLSYSKQQYIIKQIKQRQGLTNTLLNSLLNSQKETEKITLKICLVTNSTTQALYQFLVNNLPKKQNQNTVNQRKLIYDEFMKQKIKDLQIVRSIQPGFGKTTYILQKCKKQKRQCIFFPLSGRPTSSITSQADQNISIYKRFQLVCRTVYQLKQKQNKDSALVIQIHGIHKNNYEIVNTFLQELVTGRCIRHNGQFPKLLNETKLYIQIQNIQSVDGYNPLKTFTFLKHLIQIKDNVLLNTIRKLPQIDFSLNNNTKIEYIVDHLDRLEDNELDIDFQPRNSKTRKNPKNRKNIVPFKDFKPKGLDQKRARQLLNKYFFSQMKQPTFYHYQYFSRLLFEACQNFSVCYGLNVHSIQDNFDIVYRQKLGLTTIRSDFFKVMLKNCRDFIGREVSYEQFNYQQKIKTQQQLSQSQQYEIPFLIIPNTDQQSFSFIYKDHKQVPKPIQNFYISQSPDLVVKINQQSLQKLFQSHSITKLQKEDPAKFDQKIGQILFNISGNKDYSIKKDPNYVVNIDNFFKICLITLRQRQNIPIIIMGQAGIGKTALLKHISTQLYNHEFMTLNINAGTKIQDLKIYLSDIQQKYNQISAQNKKLWVFFDEFNTIKEVGYIKQIIIDKRFQGKQLKFLRQVVLMGACNPFRKLKDQQKAKTLLSVMYSQQQSQLLKTQQKSTQKKAFDVEPPPHSMIQCMFNYGALSKIEYKKYIQKMIINVNYKREQATTILLQIHDYLAETFDSSFVSLRDIQRFRTIYDFFSKKLPLNPHKNTKIYPRYSNREERALIMSFVFCYTLRLNQIQMKKQIYKKIQNGLDLQNGYIQRVKDTQQSDFYSRLKVDFSSIAPNLAIKQNTYCFFVSIYNKLPMIIVGPPGCSKSLAVRILIQNMKGTYSQDAYLKDFQAIRALNFQGSQLCTSSQVQSLFKKASQAQKEIQQNASSLMVIVFDQIGLADQSKDNPLKVIHPYLEVSKDLNLSNNKITKRNYAFIGISNSDLDISKMSRMLVLRRAQPSKEQLKETAVGIAKSFSYGQYQKISGIIQNLSEAFFLFVAKWHQKRSFKNFFSLRDFYSLIKYFLSTCEKNQISINDDKLIQQIVDESVFKNLNGMKDSVQLFMCSYCNITKKDYNQGSLQDKFNILQKIMDCFDKQNLRFPLVFVEDEESLSYLINLMINKFEKRTAYFERSPFEKDLDLPKDQDISHDNSQHVLKTTGSIIKSLQKGDKLILTNIEKTIQTSLYDMLNKFYIVRGDQNYCRVSNIQTGLIKKTLVHKNFNCIFFLLTQNLNKTQAPFLSRFQKYKFSLQKAPNANKVSEISNQIQIFKKKIIQICHKNNLEHYKIDNFFQNCDKDILKTLILRSFNEVQSEIPKISQQHSMIEEISKVNTDIDQLVRDRVIFDMVMNSTQDFSIIYKFILSQQVELEKYKQPISEALNKKKKFSLENTSDIILFTTDKSILHNGQIQQLKLIKREIDFDQKIRNFLHEKGQNQNLFILLENKDSKNVQYLISQLNKVKFQEQISNQMKFENKRFFLLFELNRKQQKSLKKQNQKDHSKFEGISYLSQFKQIFYDGKQEVDLINYDKSQFFTTVLQLNYVLQNLQQYFTIEFKCKNEENKPFLLKKFKAVYKQISTQKKNLLHRHIQSFIQKTEGTNISINQQLVFQVLQNPECLKQCKNFKEALTKQLSKKYFNGVVAFFLKYTFENQLFFAYSSKQIHDFNATQHFLFDYQYIKKIRQTKCESQYEDMVNKIMQKKINFLIGKYKQMKQARRLPSLQRKFNVQVQRARFFHFSKVQNQILLNREHGSLIQLAYNIVYVNKKIERQSKMFKQQIYKKSNFIIKIMEDGKQIERNFYIEINKNQRIKQLFVTEFLIDLVEKKGINTASIQDYMHILQLFISFNEKEKPLELQNIILAVLAFQPVLLLIFKLFSVLFDRKIFVKPSSIFFEKKRIRQVTDIKEQKMHQFVFQIVHSFFEPIFTDYNNITKYGGPKQFYQLFTNCMLQMQNLEKIVKNFNISRVLVSLKDLNSFIAQFNEDMKFQLLSNYINILNKKQIYQTLYNFVENLSNKELKTEQKSILIKFQANKIFLQWFIQKPGDKKCLQYFITKCENDVNFCHNSMHVINYLLKHANVNFQDINGVYEQLKGAQNQLKIISQISKEKNFKNNLCILMVNIFSDKLAKANNGKSHSEIISDHKQDFIKYYKKLNTNDLELQLFQIFLFVYIKFILVSYAELILQEKVDNQISELLNLESDLANNSRLFCLKIFRKYLTPKQIKDRFVLTKRFHWQQKIQTCFTQSNERSITVPKENSTKQLAQIFNKIQQSDGKQFNLLQNLLQHATNFQNRYAILNFFMRFYYTLSYNQKTYRTATIQFFISIRDKFEQKMGKPETQLLFRYLNNQISLHHSVKTTEQVNEEDFIIFNFINLFLASKDSISPLHSLFYKQGEFAQNIPEHLNNQFVLSGPENPFIAMAQYVIILTRNNNIGVYICCSDCDYIYFHQDCGWPNEQADCPYCGEKIGRKNGSHSLSRDDQGARRLMSKALADVRAYYVWYMTGLTQFWQIQRKYIRVQINRMKLKKQVNLKAKKQLIKLTGLNIVNSGRVSSLSSQIISFFIDTISYFLVSLKVLNNNQIQKLYSHKTQQQALNKLNSNLKSSLKEIKASLNLGNKLYGWMFGIERSFINQLNDFPTLFKNYQQSLMEENNKLKQLLNLRISQKKIGQDYVNLYIQFVKVVNQGYFTKDVCAVKQFTAQNQFTRDYSQLMLQTLVKNYSDDKKFDFSKENQTAQGKMQFPFDVFLTQDKIDESLYNYSRVFKLPDQPIEYHQITTKYETIIKEKYPFLDFILKQSGQFVQMKNFFNLLSFVNELHKEINNQYQRKIGQQPLKQFIDQLYKEKMNKLNNVLKDPETMLKSWKKLSSFLGVLQNGCKTVGKMNDQYDLNTNIKAFLLDQSTKENPYGLMIASIFHNFARIHNECMSILNSRKNQIKAYSSLNLFNELLKINPQVIEQENIFIIDQTQFKQKLEQCSVASINYGQNFIFHNFDAYQEYFLKKLQGKCEIISNLAQYISVCYNGEAFSAQTEGSAVPAELRQILDKKLSFENIEKVKCWISSIKDTPQYESKMVCLRGDLQKIMLAMNTLKGNYNKEDRCQKIIQDIQIKIKSFEFKDQFADIPVSEIFDLYETLQDELKPLVLKKLSDKYKVKMTEQMAQNVQNYLKQIPQQPDEQNPTIEQIESAVVKFISRTLQNGIFQTSNKLFQFVINRADFWPKDYSDDKKYTISYDLSMNQIEMAHVISLLEIIQKIRNKRQNK